MKIPTLFLLATLLGAGCLGVPQGTPDVGDTVRVSWAALDVETGERIDGGNALTFVIGSGRSGLGYDFEYSMVGQQPNATFRFESDDPSRDFREEFRRPALLGRYDPVATESTASFEQVTGPVQEGDIVPLGAYTVRVENITAGRITYRYVVDGVQSDDITDVFGSNLLTYIEGDELVQRLSPVPGSRFVVVQNSPMNLQFGMPVGSYETRGLQGDQIVFGYSPSTRMALLGQPIIFEVTILTIVEGQKLVPGDNIGIRQSPQLLADPAKVLPPAVFGHEHAEGDDHGHTH